MHQTFIMVVLDARYLFNNFWHFPLQLTVQNSTFTVGWLGGWVSGWINWDKTNRSSSWAEIWTGNWAWQYLNILTYLNSCLKAIGDIALQKLLTILIIHLISINQLSQ